MTRPRNIPINLAQGTSQRVDFIFDDMPDLSDADIVMIVKRVPTDEECVLVKTPDLAKSPNLSDGKFTISLVPSDTSGLPSRTYVYEVKVTIGTDIFIPLQGDFNVFNAISQ